MTKATTVLVVEDDEALNDAYAIILESSGYHVLRAHNGQEALTVIAGQPKSPDVILLDLRMPVLDGVGFLEKFVPANHPDSTIIVFSNYDTHADIDKAYSLGAHKYVLKARTAPKELLKLVQSVVKSGSK